MSTEDDITPAEVTEDRVGLVAEPDKDEVTGDTDGHEAGDDEDDEDDEENSVTE